MPFAKRSPLPSMQSPASGAPGSSPAPRSSASSPATSEADDGFLDRADAVRLGLAIYLILAATFGLAVELVIGSVAP